LIFLLPLNGDRRRLRFLSFSRLVSSKSLEKLDEIARFEIRATNEKCEYSEEKEKRREEIEEETILTLFCALRMMQKDNKKMRSIPWATSLMRAKKNDFFTSDESDWLPRGYDDETI